MNAITGYVEDGIGNIVGFVAGLPGAIAGAVSGAFDSIWENFKSVVNRIIDAWNGLRFPSITIPGFDPPGPGSFPSFSTPAIGVPTIPRLAKGGVLYDPTVFLGGEYAGSRLNPETVAPQSITLDTVREALREARDGPSIGLQNNGDVKLDDIGVETIARRINFAMAS